MSLVRGENVLVYIYSGGFWKLVVCGRSCTLNTNAESIETSITGTGVWRTYEYTANSWTGNIDGVVQLLMVNTVALPDIRALQYSQTKILFRYQRTDDNGNVYLEEGTALIKSVSDTGDYNNMNTFSVELLGSGPLTAIFTPTPVDPSGKVKRYEYTGIAGETSFSDILLNMKDVIDVVVDGVGRSKLITSGTPLGQEAKYTSGGGVGIIEVPQPLVAGVQVYVLYQDM